jgi:tRNA-dihydrouridine synthase B
MKYVLAPLAGFTDAPFRRLCHEGGADLVYTEMVSAAGLAHGSSPTRHLMETMPGEGPVAVQLFGAKEDELALSVREMEGFSEINLNAGCPMTKVTRCGAGAKLVEDPEKIRRLLKAMTENTDIPVTLKTRLGPHPQKTNIFEILDAAEKAGAKGITVHARYTSQMHGGPVHLDRLKEVVTKSKLPVTGNGSVVDARTAAAMAETGVSAIMIGRAALTEPGIFGRLKGREEGLDGLRGLEGFEGLEKLDDSARLCLRHLKYLLDFRKQLVQKFPHDHIPGEDGYASVKMHVHLFRYFSGKPGAAALRARLNSVRTLTEIFDIISAYGTGRII